MTGVPLETLGCESLLDCEEWYSMFKTVCLKYFFLLIF